MNVQQLIENARSGQTAPVHILVGPERFLSERAVALLRTAALGDGPSGFNDEVFHGNTATAASITGAARTLPMMAPSRFVLVRHLEAMAASEMDGLVDYLADPAPSTCLVMVADKLDGRGKLAKAAKKQGYLVDAGALKGGALRAFAIGEAKARGHRLSAQAADALLDATGDDLASLDDAVERLSLYVAPGQPIETEAVEAAVTRVRTDTIWTVVDAVSSRNPRRALGAASSMLAAREPPLRILAMVARQLRMVARMRQSLASGMRPEEAAKAAGAPPFKARDLSQAAKRFTAQDLRVAFRHLAEADRALKGSKRPPATVLQEVLVSLCSTQRR